MSNLFFITTDNLKHHKDVFVLCTEIYIMPQGSFGYTATIEDGGKPKPYLQDFRIVRPQGRSCIITGSATSLDEAKARLQEIADKYGSLTGRVPIIVELSGEDNEEDDEDK